VGVTPLPAALLDRYLTRAGARRAAPSAEALVALHRSVVERISYETVWIHSGEARGLDPVAAATRIAEGRGGYCFHMNGALAAALAALGYQVTHHIGGVHGAEGPSNASHGNHLVLLVHGLPTAANPGGTWYVDAGLGDALHEPLPLVAGGHSSGPFRYELVSVDPTPTSPADWLFVHDPRGTFVGMGFSLAEASMADFEPHHRRLSTDPASHFWACPGLR
jgi:N-hydroxyarylamine O-acetyltransferase